MSPVTKIAAILALALAAVAAPAPAENAAASSSGQLTYYYPGLGACGQTNGANDAIVAVSAPLFDAQRPCGRNIRVHYQGRSVMVRVVDRCAGCAYNDLDLSPSAFQQVVGDLGKGRVPASWEWA
ncbi:hypothetical protein CDD82_1524 [Ophiocordyceps australis]|uniref:RlpA-like protein double-psi beta-barrel domain-containing protein n=1 Tax=Ophiocordyceps australis TaxID=1399860 RepID=A0A2C5XM81_9HYPO|nr:hypothetical protein CDD82_1524 [Ophiocordyceps australis]